MDPDITNEEAAITEVVETFANSIQPPADRSLTEEELLSIERACQHLKIAIAVIQDLADRGLIRKVFATEMITKATDSCTMGQTIIFVSR